MMFKTFFPGMFFLGMFCFFLDVFPMANFAGSGPIYLNGSFLSRGQTVFFAFFSYVAVDCMINMAF